MKVLYITYDGVSDFVSRSQVIPYLEKLHKKEVDITLISFEKNLTNSLIEQNKHPFLKNITWIPKKYHKRPTSLATLFDVLVGIFSGISIIRKKKIDFIHARSYVAFTIGYVLKCLLGKKIIFDMRGFWVDEKVDAGKWKNGSILYTVAKKCEDFFIKKADEIIVLTNVAKDSILKSYSIKTPISVIPCAVNMEFFKFTSEKPVVEGIDFSRRKVILYAGNLGSFYCLDKILEVFKFFKGKDEDYFLWFLTNYSYDAIVKKAEEARIDRSDYHMSSLAYRDMQKAFSIADFSIIFYKRLLSGKGCAPIKFGESLACGTPVVINSGIGDLEEIVSHGNTGYVVKDFSTLEYQAAFDKMNELVLNREEVKTECRQTAVKLFSLDDATEKYMNVYKRLK